MVTLDKENTSNHLEDVRRGRINKRFTVVSGTNGDLNCPDHLKGIYSNHLEALQLVFKAQFDGTAGVW